MNCPIQVALQSRLARIVCVCVMALGARSASGELKSHEAAHEIIAANSGFVLYRIKIEGSHLASLQAHKYPTIRVATSESEVLEFTQSTGSNDSPATWESRSGITTIRAGSTHAMFNPHPEMFTGVEIEVLAGEANLWLKPRFSKTALDQTWIVGNLSIGKHVLSGGGVLELQDGCSGVMISMTKGVVKVISPSGITSEVGEGDVVMADGGLQKATRRVTGGEFISVCQATS